MTDDTQPKDNNKDKTEERSNQTGSIAGASDINQGQAQVNRPSWLTNQPPAQAKPPDEALLRALAKINADENGSDSGPSPVISPIQKGQVPTSNPSSVRTWQPNPELFSSRRSTAGPLGSSTASSPNISSARTDTGNDTTKGSSKTGAGADLRPGDRRSPSITEQSQQPSSAYPAPPWTARSTPPSDTASNTKQQSIDPPAQASSPASAPLRSATPAPAPPSTSSDQEGTWWPPLPTVSQLDPGPMPPSTEPTSIDANNTSPVASMSAASASPRPTVFPSGDDDGLLETSSDPVDYSYPIPSYTTIGSQPAAQIDLVPAEVSSADELEEDLITGVSKIVSVQVPSQTAAELLGPDFTINADEIDPDEFVLDERREGVFTNVAKAKGIHLGPGIKFSLVGQVLFDSYSLLDAVGESATCEVYSALQLKTDSLVAVKTPKTGDYAFMRNFADAVKTQGRLKHPNIVRSLAYLESAQGQPFYIMEHLTGVSMEEILASVEKLDEEDGIAQVLYQAASALEYAHLKGIFHGRLTPHNILMADQDDQLQAKLMDFQVAAVCATARGTTGRVINDDCYLSPETHKGEPFSARSDIYSLGAIAYKVATGLAPGKIVDTNIERELDPVAKHNPDLKFLQDLDALIQQALEPNPSYRFETATEFKSAVESWIKKVHEDDDVESGGPDEAVNSEIDNLNREDSVAVEGLNAESAGAGLVGETPGSAALTRKSKRRQRRKGQIRTTIHQLVELKKNQNNQERTAVMRFTKSVSVKGPRQSPLVSLAKLIVAIAIFTGVGLGSALFIVSNPDRVRSSFTEASLQLSQLWPGRSKTKDDPTQLRVGVEPMIKPSQIPKSPAKVRTKDVHATPQLWALPEGKRGLRGLRSVSFGVTNNWQQKKGNRRVIERLDGKQ